MSGPFSQGSLPLGVTVSIGDVVRWRAEIDQVDDSIRALQTKKLKLEQLVQVAETLFGLIGPTELDTHGPQLPPPNMSLSEVAPDACEQDREADGQTDTVDEGKVTFVSAVRQSVYAAELGLVPHEIRAQLAQGPLASRLAESDKGFHHAISRLTARGTIVRHNGRLYSPAALARFKDLVAAGKLTDEEPTKPQIQSPMGEAILRIVESSPGVKGGGIIMRLRENPEFAATLSPHTTGAYNVISRLVHRGQLVKVGREYFRSPNDG